MIMSNKGSASQLSHTTGETSVVRPGEYTVRYGVLDNNSTGDLVIVNEPNEQGTSRIERHLVDKGLSVFASEPALQLVVDVFGTGGLATGARVARQ